MTSYWEIFQDHTLSDLTKQGKTSLTWTEKIDSNTCLLFTTIRVLLSNETVTASTYMYFSYLSAQELKLKQRKISTDLKLQDTVSLALQNPPYQDSTLLSMNSFKTHEAYICQNMWGGKEAHSSLFIQLLSLWACHWIQIGSYFFLH